MRSMAISHSMRHHTNITYCIRSQPLYQNDDYQLLYLNNMHIFTWSFSIVLPRVYNSFCSTY